MKKIFKITKTDKKILQDMGCIKEDFKQIEEAANVGDFIYTSYQNKPYTKNITHNEAIKLLGREKFLSGLLRSAFHFSAIRYIKEENKDIYIYFDMKKLFN
jgi:hypothetical protein